MKCTVVGAGISGLSTAYYIQKFAHEKKIPLEIEIFDADNHVGGKIVSENTQGFLMEWGPNGFLDSKPSTLDLCRDISLSDRLMASLDASRKRFIFARNQLLQLPDNPVKFFRSPLLSPLGRLRIIREIFVPKGPGSADESLADFATRRLGKEVLEMLIDPMVSGIFAGDPEKLSVKSAFPRIVELEQSYGGLIRAMISLGKARKKEMKKTGVAKPKAGPAGPGGVLTSFEKGTAVLTETLAQTFQNTIFLAHRLCSISCTSTQNEKKYILTWQTPEGRKTSDTDVLVLATPAYQSAEVLNTINPKLTEVLKAIPYAAVAVVGIGFERKQVSHPLDAFGFVVPYKEGKDILGTLFTSSIFNGRTPDNHVLFRTMVGGQRKPHLVQYSEDDLISLVRKNIDPLLGISGNPTFTKIVKHERAIPQYCCGHEKLLQKIDQETEKMDHFFLTGNAYRGIGMNDCTREALVTAKKVIDSINPS